MKVTVEFSDYNVQAFEEGTGLNIQELDQESLQRALSFALGFIDYTEPSIASELLKKVEDEELDKPFMELYQAGKVNQYYVEHAIRKWEESSQSVPVHEYLGMSEDDYRQYLETLSLPQT
ncbi:MULTISPECIES: hypothetical protein [unclassified Exiguobacterium]|uniref:hypothetical protein n=1 Tax=unclassified Exiguobacterium TaxID=2644629 RepID=UPI001BEA357A|nr:MULTISPECIES: hypothetical protein [unclassified Exiguobacterium]